MRAETAAYRRTPALARARDCMLERGGCKAANSYVKTISAFRLYPPNTARHIPPD